MIAYIRSSLIQRDVRAQKYIHFLSQKDFITIQWDRTNETQEDPLNCITFRGKAEYGKRLKSIFKFFQWNWFLLKTINQNRDRIKVIQINDFDSFFGVIIFRLIGKKIIFDVYDFFTDSKLSNSRTLFYTLLYHIEMFCLRFVDLLILPLELRKKNLNFNPRNLFICENVPLINENSKIEIELNSNLINVVYAGTLEPHNRGLEWIPHLAEKLKDKVHFYIAGTGGLSNFFIDAADKISNITFLGPLTHPQALSLQEKADLIYGIYRTNLVNNVMAAPNKFYESAYLGTPFITNYGLMISNLIQENSIGLVIEENQEALYKLLDTIQKEQIAQIGSRAKAYWNNNYSNYIQNKYHDEYQSHLTRLTSA